MNVQEFLSTKEVAFELLPHNDAFEAQRLAEELHVSGETVAKTVLLRADGGYAYLVAVLPANKRVDLAKVSAAFGGSRIELASELEVAEHCPDCECGTLPPFGAQYGMRTIVDESLTGDEQIVFEGNNHHEAIRMRYADFRAIEEPLVGHFST